MDRTMKHGNYYIANEKDAYLQPIISTNDCKNHIITALQRVIDTCKHQTIKAISEYQEESKGQKSLVLASLFKSIELIEKNQLKKIFEKPFCLQKADIDTVDKISSMIGKFNAICCMTL